MGKTRHAFVIGSGIAGLSLAEILSRNGWTITLVESATELGGDASRNTQNWLHTGWLYAALPYDSAMLACSRALRLFRATYGQVLSDEIVNVEAGPQGVTYPPSSKGWFASEVVHYLFAINTYDLTVWEKVTWRHYLDWVALRRLRKLGYSTEPTGEIHPGLCELMSHWEGGAAGHERYRVIPSTDTRMDTSRILGTLVALLGDDATVVTGARCELVADGARTAVRIDGELHKPDLVVVAAGKGTPLLLERLSMHALARRMTSIRSPIVVLDRALDLPNFIRFTPRLPETVNHIKVCVPGFGELSTIGSYDYYPVDQIPDIRPFVAKVCKRLDVSPDAVLGSYYGTKTELTGGLPRRYNHAIEQINDNSYIALAGKFSQFPLLVHDFAEKMGLRTDIANPERGTLSEKIGRQGPETLALGLRTSMSTFVAAKSPTA